MSKLISIKSLLPLLLLAIALLVRLFYAVDGHFGFDDMHYAKLSAQVADGVFQTNGDHYTFRWGLIVLNGLVYALLGISDYTSAIVPMLATLATAALVWRMGAGLSWAARFFAVFFTGLSEWVFFYSTKIMPDILVMFSITAAMAAYWEYRFGSWQQRSRTAALVFSGSLFFGFLCKETVFLIAPLLLWLIVSDLWKGRGRAFWQYAAFSGLGVLVAYFAYTGWLSGSIVGRFKAIADNSYFNACSYDQLPVEHLIRRVKSELWRVFFETGVAVGFVFLIPGLFRKGVFKNDTSSHFLLFTSLSMLLLSNFMSTSPTVYIPLCPDIRHFLFAVPFLGLAAAIVADEMMNTAEVFSKKYFAVPVLSVVAALIAWKLFPDVLKLYGSLALATTVIVALRLWRVGAVKTIGWALLLIVLCWKPIRVIRAAQTSNYANQRELVRTYLGRPMPSGRTLTVITNNAEKNIDQYLLQFDSAQVRFLSFREVTTEKIAAADSVALLMNGTTAWMSNTDWDKLPVWVRQPDSSRVPLAQGDHIELFGLNKADLLRSLSK